MPEYRHEDGRVITRALPDPRLERSRRWNRVVPLSPIPEPEREPEHTEKEE